LDTRDIHEGQENFSGTGKIFMAGSAGYREYDPFCLFWKRCAERLRCVMRLEPIDEHFEVCRYGVCVNRRADDDKSCPADGFKNSCHIVIIDAEARVEALVTADAFVDVHIVWVQYCTTPSGILRTFLYPLCEPAGVPAGTGAGLDNNHVMVRDCGIPTGRGKVSLNKTGGIALQIMLPLRGFLHGRFSGTERDIRFVFVGIGSKQNRIKTFPLHAYRIPEKTRIETGQVFPSDDKM